MLTMVNPNNEGFKRNLNNNIYVDKTLLIEKLNSFIEDDNNRICVSRPRRFGKTMATQLLTAYYSCGCDSRELFINTKLSNVEGWDKYLNKFNVIKIDVQGLYGIAQRSNIDLTNKIQEAVNSDLLIQFPNIKDLDINKSLSDNIITIYNETNTKFVMILDEYDVLIRDKRKNDVLDNYLRLLNTLFKGETISEAFALVYLTGIFPLVKDKSQSWLYNFYESSITKPGELSKYFGFTEDEVQDLCIRYNMDYNKCKNWYDGYKVGEEESIYNPCSIERAMNNHSFEDYWSGTGSYLSISNCLQQNIEGVYEDVTTLVRDNNKVFVDTSHFQNSIVNLNSKYEIFTFLIHIGYLSYNESESVCYIPNNEIRKDWISALYEIDELKPLYYKSRSLIDD